MRAKCFFSDVVNLWLGLPRLLFMESKKEVMKEARPSITDPGRLGGLQESSRGLITQPAAGAGLGARPGTEHGSALNKSLQSLESHLRMIFF